MELAEIAASVAKALGLPECSGSYSWLDTVPADFEGSKAYLYADGSNLFDPYWQVRCRDWLLKRGWHLAFRTDGEHEVWRDGKGDVEQLELRCPASEFCARAIHALNP